MTNTSACRTSGAEYVWRFPGSPVRIHIPLDVVAQLRDHLLSEYGPDPDQYRERGGLLLGVTAPGRVDISGIEFFPSETSNRHFALSEADAEVLRIRIAQRQEIVGYFRTDVHTGVRLSDEDMATAQNVFRNPKFVFLVAHAHQTIPVAGFFFWEGGTILRDMSFMEFPLVPELLPDNTQAVAQSGEFTTPEFESESAVEHAIPGKRVTTGRGRKLTLAAAPIVALLAIYFAARFVPAPRPEDNPVKPIIIATPLSLSAARTRGGISITWDGAAASVSGARMGLLTITEGQTGREFPLTREQLRMQKFVYLPQTGKLEVTLEVFSTVGQSARESLVVVAEDAGMRLDSVKPTTSAPSSIATEGARSAPRPFTPPTELATLTPAEVSLPSEAPPSIRIEPVNSADTLKAPAQIMPTFRSEPPSTERHAANAPIAAPAVEPPKVVREVRPVVPRNLWKQWLGGPMEVRIRVSIDEWGHVTAAAPIEAPESGISGYIAKIAADASRQWTFTPARRGNAPLPSEMVLRFTFIPER